MRKKRNGQHWLQLTSMHLKEKPIFIYSKCDLDQFISHLNVYVLRHIFQFETICTHSFIDIPFANTSFNVLSARSAQLLKRIDSYSGDCIDPGVSVCVCSASILRPKIPFHFSIYTLCHLGLNGS